MKFTDIIFQMDFLIEKLSLLDLNLKTEQEQAIKELYSGRDVLTVLPKGFGKSRIITSVSETETRRTARWRAPFSL